MGQPDMLKAYQPKGSKPAELKHLSRRRRRKQIVIAQVVASERVTAQTSVVKAIEGL